MYMKPLRGMKDLVAHFEVRLCSITNQALKFPGILRNGRQERDHTSIDETAASRFD
jgi:hypothetical protein